MTHWQRKLLLQPEWDLAADKVISIQELAAALAKRLRALPAFRGKDAYLNGERDEIADDFDGIANDQGCDADDFDEVMERLYDWGDTQTDGKFFDAKKVCWIDLFTGATP